MRAAAAVVLGLSLLAACALPPQTPASRAATCEGLLRDFEREVRFTDPYTSELTLKPAIDRLAGQIMRADCITSGRDLGDLIGLRLERAGVAPAPPGGLPPVPVHAGVVPGIGDEIAALQFFRGLGYEARSIDAPGLGRRIYVGPLTSDAQIIDVIEISRRAGFVAPYVSDDFRIGFIPSLL